VNSPSELDWLLKPQSSRVSLILIEHAKRFGLTQLHQLRWRGGRDTAVNPCVRLYDSPLSDNRKARLMAMNESQVERSWLQDAQTTCELLDRWLTASPTSCARGPR
jgi:hypothetical protein